MLTDEYRAVLVETHQQNPKWGASARRRARNISKLIKMMGAKRILDYGCGKGALKTELETLPDEGDYVLEEYDPGIPGKDKLPQGDFDLVICVDVMEHVEEQHVQQVIDHISLLSSGAAMFVISTKEDANHPLSDGRGAHITVHGRGWWIPKLESAFPKVESSVISATSEIYAMCAPKRSRFSVSVKGMSCEAR